LFSSVLGLRYLIRERSGPSTAIVVNGTPYLVDFGTGLIRRAAAARNKGVAGLEPTNLKIGFIMHLHSDHMLGFPDVIPTPSVMGRKQPLEVYGPQGTQDMAEHILKAYEVDIKSRTEAWSTPTKPASARRRLTTNHVVSHSGECQ
jgi:Metal-dependent hydrolases of the beta-lactamase superfamily III